MIDQITILETCWFVSPPWREQIPPIEVNLLERVYLKSTKTFGYCCGIQWRQNCWIYMIACKRSLVQASHHQVIGTGRFQRHGLEKPAFVLGGRVMLRSGDDSPKQRLILGVQLLNASWSYYIEWMSADLEATNLENRLALIPQKDLVRVLI